MSDAEVRKIISDANDYWVENMLEMLGFAKGGHRR